MFHGMSVRLPTMPAQATGIGTTRLIMKCTQAGRPAAKGRSSTGHPQAGAVHDGKGGGTEGHARVIRTSEMSWDGGVGGLLKTRAETRMADGDR